MAKNNQNIRMSGTLVSANTVKAGGHITMGIDHGTTVDLVVNPDKYYVALYVVDKAQFDALK